MTTRRHPRTMQQAWGPYTDRKLYPLPDHSNPSGTRTERVLSVILAIAIGLSIALLLVNNLSA